MWHEIDYPYMQKLQNLFLINFSHRIVKNMLGLPRRWIYWIYGNAMGAKGRTYPLEVFERLDKGRAMPF
jgi:hypothetical protein